MTTTVTNGNAYQWGLHRQASATSVGSVADYALPVFDADVKPVWDVARVGSPDASGLPGVAYKKPTYWQADVTIPALGASLGAVVQSMWVTDTGIASGTADYSHAFSGLTSQPPFVSLYDDFTNASKPMTYGTGITSEITFSADQDGGPLKVKMSAVGQTPSQTAYTVTTTDAVSNGYFAMQLSGSTIEIDNDTPDVNPSSSVTNVESFSLTVSRDVKQAAVADNTTMTVMPGGVAASGSMTFFYSSWQEFLASYFGSVSGNAVSTTIVYGALDLTFKHTVQSSWSFELYVPKVAFKIPARQPDATGGPLTLPVELIVEKPASGDIVQPVLVNSTSTNYQTGASLVFSPSDLSELVAWYDFSDASMLFTDTGRTTGVGADGDSIKGVTNKAGATGNVTEATNAPTYKTAIQNGKSIARFVGASSQKLSSATNVAALAINGDLSIFAVASKTIATTSCVITAYQTGAGSTNSYEFRYTNAASPKNDFVDADGAGAETATGTTTVTNNAFHAVGIVRVVASSYTFYVDGSAAGTGSLTKTPISGVGSALTIGTRVSAGLPLTGDIGELLIFNGALSAPNIAAVQSYLKSKWGTP